jgi:hypothetical protein
MWAISSKESGLLLAMMMVVFASGTVRRSVVSLNCFQRMLRKSFTLAVLPWPQTGVVLCFHNSSDVNLEKGGLHVCDLSSDGTQERYEFIHGSNNMFGFEIASAALLYKDKSNRSSVEQCSSHAVRFERSLESKMNEELYSSYSGCIFREGGPLGCLTSCDRNWFSEVTDHCIGLYWS